MKKELIVTSDGSHSVAIPEMGVTYHSSHGAIQESMHVFIKAGLQFLIASQDSPETINILEMGFGTGLNALLTIAAAEQQQQKIYYETIEQYPLEATVFIALNYCEQLQRPDLVPLFELMHRCPWNEPIAITPYFVFKKNQINLLNFSTTQLFNLIYFDAFAPEIQPALWTVDIFKKIHSLMMTDAVLTTYCSKSIVRKAMAEAGLQVEKIPGPPHKREIVRAVRG